jgi:hypothetical protein
MGGKVTGDNRPQHMLCVAVFQIGHDIKWQASHILALSNIFLDSLQNNK